MSTEISQRLTRLRAEIEKRGVNGFLIPREDEFQGEYVPDSAMRLAWATGFTGSAGFAVVLENKAAFFTDGRYTVQMKKQIDAGLFDRRSTAENQGDIPTQTPEEWIKENLPQGAKLGYDPWLHTENGLKALLEAVKAAGGELVACDSNPLDASWTDRPAPPNEPVVAHDVKFAGKPSADKRHEIGAQLAKDNCDAAVLTLGDSVAWLLNIRGNDVPCTPFALSYAILNKDGTVDWFIDEKKFEPGLKNHLGPEVRVHAAETFESFLKGMSGKTVLSDPGKSPARIAQILESAGATVARKTDPCQLPKARKNETEIAGMIEAHKRDGVAVVRALARITGAKGLSELDIADIMVEERRKGENFRDISFDTIAGSGGNGAIVHYRATEEDHSKVKNDTLLLIDSGAQYLDGTTDITRTIAIGTPTQEMKERFTLVLKGHIDLARAEFEAGTTGDVLDIKARAALKEKGLDYAHGTGHGVGSYLSVHEGPAGISPRSKTAPLMPGMILSNEPGYYKEGEYGIRIESLIVVRESKDKPGCLHFDTITMAPIDRNLIEPSLLGDEQLEWLNDYHRKVRETLTPRLDAKTAKWLADATAPIGKPPEKTVRKIPKMCL